MPVTALIADDEPHLARYLQEQLLALWPELAITHVARNGIEAAQLIAAHRPALAFLDIKMPGLSGLEVAQGIDGARRFCCRGCERAKHCAGAARDARKGRGARRSLRCVAPFFTGDSIT